MSAVPKKQDLSHFPVDGIRAAAENDLIYDRFGIGNADDCTLTISIQENGIQEPLAELAAKHRLSIEPGRNVIEVRSGTMHKGIALRTFVEEQEAGGVVFMGDDLGDAEAFEAVHSLREDGLPGLAVCSASEEQPALVELADVVVDGPDGVVDLLRRLTR